jgi:hypothetical protein
VHRVERAIARVTEHAFQRAKQRLGWPPSATARMAQKALDCGVRHQDTAGRLRRFLDHQFLLHGHGNNTRIYGQHVFIFEGPVLITILYLPNELRRAAQSARH